MGQQVFLVIHIVLALAIIGLILLQHGKGAEVGAAFGSGASQTLFGSRGSATFLTKLTTVFAACFAVTSLSMAYMATNNSTAEKSILDIIEEVQKAEELPTIPAQVDNTGKADAQATDHKAGKHGAKNANATLKSQHVDTSTSQDAPQPVVDAAAPKQGKHPHNKHTSSTKSEQD